MTCDPISFSRTLRRFLAVAAGLGWVCAPIAHADSDYLPGSADDSHKTALTCMTQAIAYEAGFEPLNGKQAVAEVILNRTHNPRFPTSVCGVIYQGAERTTGCQFTFTCDGSLRRHLPDWVIDQARAVASVALENQLPPQVAGAINYHADYVSPRWATAMIRTTKIGRHIFYRSPGLASASGYAAISEPEEAGTLPGESPAPEQKRPSPSRPIQDFSLWGLGKIPSAQPGPIRPTG